jgi:hypothetical protein
MIPRIIIRKPKQCHSQPTTTFHLILLKFYMCGIKKVEVEKCGKLGSATLSGATPEAVAAISGGWEWQRYDATEGEASKGGDDGSNLNHWIGHRMARIKR